MEWGNAQPWRAERPPHVGLAEPMLLDPGSPPREVHSWLARELGRYVTWVLVGSQSPPAASSCSPRLAGSVVNSRGPASCRESGATSESGRVSLGAACTPAIAVADVGSLAEARVREHFTERVFALARLEELSARPFDLGRLVDFHTRHKLQLSAHDQRRYRLLGRLVASAKGRPPESVLAEYTRTFRVALAVPTTAGKRGDAFYHGLGHLKKLLDQDQRRTLRALVDAYVRAEVPLSAPLQLFGRYVELAGAEYLLRQTFLWPYPDDLGLAAAL